MDRRSGLLVGLVLIAAAALLVVQVLQSRQTDVATNGSPTPAASFPPPMAVEDLYAAFEAGGSATSAGEPTSLTTVPAGDLMLPTGRVVAADVFFFTTEPFTRRLPVGRHPVLLLSSARDPELVGDVAAAMIRVAPGDPVSWELAVVPGQDPTTLQPGEFWPVPERRRLQHVGRHHRRSGQRRQRHRLPFGLWRWRISVVVRARRRGRAARAAH